VVEELCALTGDFLEGDAFTGDLFALDGFAADFLDAVRVAPFGVAFDPPTSPDFAVRLVDRGGEAMGSPILVLGFATLLGQELCARPAPCTRVQEGSDARPVPGSNRS